MDRDLLRDEWLLASGSYSDLNVLPALCDGYHALIYIGDKGYVDVKTYCGSAVGICCCRCTPTTSTTISPHAFSASWAACSIALNRPLGC